MTEIRINNPSTSVDVNNTTTNVDVTNNEIAIVYFARGVQGEQGIQGEQGPQGPAGDTGLVAAVSGQLYSIIESVSGNLQGQIDGVTAGLSAYTLRTETASVSAGLQDTKTSNVTTAAVSAGLSTRIDSIVIPDVSGLITRVESAAISAGLQLTKAATTTVADVSAGLSLRIDGKVTAGQGSAGNWNNVIVNSDGIVTSGGFYDYGSTVNLTTYTLRTETAAVSAGLQLTKAAVTTVADISAGLSTRIDAKADTSTLALYTLKTDSAALSANLQDIKTSNVTTAAISAGLSTRIDGKISTGLGSAGNWNNVIVNADGIVTSGGFYNYGASVDLSPYTLRTETIAVSSNIIATVAAVSAGLQLTKAATTTVAAISAGLDARINLGTLKTETAAVSAYLFATTAAVSANLQDVKTSVVTTAAISAGLAAADAAIRLDLANYTLLTTTAAISANLQNIKASVSTVAAISAGLDTRISSIVIPSTAGLITTVEVAAISAGLQLAKAATTTVAAISAGLQTQINAKADTSTLALYSLKTDSAALSANLQDVKTSVVTTAAISAGLSTRVGTLEGTYTKRASSDNSVYSSDTRALNIAPSGMNAGLYVDFKQDTTDGLSDGGFGYHGVLTFRPYGIGSDYSGGPAAQIGTTANGNVWVRNSTDPATWGAWSQLGYRSETVAASANIISTVAAVSANLQDAKTSIVTTAAISAGLNAAIGIHSADISALYSVTGIHTTDISNLYAADTVIRSTIAAVSANLQNVKASVSTVAAISAGLDTRITALSGLTGGIVSRAAIWSGTGAISASSLLYEVSTNGLGPSMTVGTTSNVMSAGMSVNTSLYAQNVIANTSQALKDSRGRSIPHIAVDGSVRLAGAKNWVGRVAGESGTWYTVCWSPELRLFCSVANSGTNRGMTSPDGITWTPRNIGSANTWTSVCWSPELRLFCAVADTGTGQVGTSPDGINWTTRSASEANSWFSVCWSPELRLFCAVSAAGTNRVMTSPDGITWDARAATEANQWGGVCWSPELRLFCAVSLDGTNRVMTSADGVTWVRSAASEVNAWRRICWCPELRLFVAVSSGGTNRVMTSPDGITWTARAGISETNQWYSVCWSPELRKFCAVSISTGATNQVMISDVDNSVDLYNTLTLTQNTTAGSSSGSKNFIFNTVNTNFAISALDQNGVPLPITLQPTGAGRVIIGSSTDNGINRLQVSGTVGISGNLAAASINTTGTIGAGASILSIGPTSGIGYATGAGGAVTQATSRTTGVTLDKVCGAITLVSAAGSTTIASFTVTNSTVAATDVVNVVQKSGTDLYRIYVTNVAAGSFKISFATLAGATVEQPVFNFAVQKAVTS